VSSAAIVAEGIWKRYDRSGGRAPTIKRLLTQPLRHRRRSWFWALQDVSLRLEHGETLGVIGRNGAGKSTLLRVVSGLGRPTRGRIVRAATPTAVLTLGETFNPLLTGWENALTAAIVSGKTRRQAVRILDDVVEFSELGEFFEQPLRTYSDGMRVRLAFAVAVSTDPDILVIDEVLSVGDLSFQEKCIDRIAEIQARGAAILFASHVEGIVRRLCTRAIWLSRGEVMAAGSTEEVYEAYRSAVWQETARRAAELRGDDGDGAASSNGGGGGRPGTHEIEVVAARMSTDTLAPASREGGHPFELEVELEPRTPVDEPNVGVFVTRADDGRRAFAVSSKADGISLGRITEPMRLRLRLEELALEPGPYEVAVGIWERDNNYIYDYRAGLCTLTVAAAPSGMFGPRRSWTID
jgi:lipopolysaccharide transport system ATP-binding protein